MTAPNDPDLLEPPPGRPTPAVTVIGCDGRPPAPDALAALAKADLVVGAPRHLDSAPIPPNAERQPIKHLADTLDAVERHRGRVAVLASGDPGFFGIVRALRARGITPAVIPAVSSVALAFARLGLDWDDALVLSAHGRDPRHALAAALAHPKAVILTAPANVTGLAADLLTAGKRVYLAERLGTPEERITDLAAGPPSSLSDPAGPSSSLSDPARPLADPNLLISLTPQTSEAPETPDPPPAPGALTAVTSPSAPGSPAAAILASAPAAPRWLAGHPGAPDGWALPEDAFEHRNSMITKAEVRALVLARLGPAPGRTIWDVGAGSGSVAVECARFGAWVIAVEADPAQCARIRKNAANHGVYLRVLHGRAPEALAGLPPADALFVGGGDNVVLAAAVRAASPARVVVTLAAIQRVAETADLLTDLGYHPEGVQLQANRLTPLATPTGPLRLVPENPIFILWAEHPNIVDQNFPYRGSNDPRSRGPRRHPQRRSQP
jgi:precorrin-6B C5,15-methyltransferase / cobalt-precorrin-6B C5,C15-methyltransferase